MKWYPVACMRPCVALLVLALIASPAGAGDLNPPPGPVAGTMKTLSEVEPRIAVNATNTPGDADSLYKITQPGSYYLTGNVVGVAGKNGIKIFADGVTLDLNGFEVAGVPGSFSGVLVTSGSKTIVRNGTVRNWGGVGVYAASEAQIEHINAVANGNDGIRVGSFSRIIDCMARGNTNEGIEVDDGSMVVHCIASGSMGDGIRARADCVIQACIAFLNGGSGIVCASAANVSDCAVYFNTGTGIMVASGSSVNGSAAYYNGADGFNVGASSIISRCAASTNDSDGIEINWSCQVMGNVLDQNGFSTGDGAGIHVTGNYNRIVSNLCTRADRGLHIDGTDNHVSDNTVRNNTDNYDIAAGNQLNLLLGQIPESIDWPATVKLAGDLTGVSGSNGITIAADNVTIDLDGHALVGVGGSLDGISVSGSRRNIAVRNGTARNWAGDGIDAASAGNSRFDDLRLSSNTGDGLRVGVDCAVRACLALSNGGDGIEGGGNGTIIECFANANTMTGILAGDSTIVTNCEAAFNSVDGIRVATGSSVRHCTVRGSAGDGIEAGTSCTIAENQTDLCGNGAGSGAGVHITGTGCRVEGNTCLSADRGVDVDGTGNLIIRNTARGNTTNYDIVAGNRYGPIIDITAGGTAAVSGNSAASTMSSTDPWANFAH